VLGSKLAETLTDVPVLVRLRGPAIDLGALAPDGGDLRFFAADQVTSLAYEIDQLTGAGVDVWVRVPEIRAGTDEVVWLTYRDPTATSPGQTEQVWSADFIAVWHLGGDGRDATSHHLDAAATGTVEVAGIAGLGRDLQGGWLEAPDSPASEEIGANGTATFSAWVNLAAYPPAGGAASVLDRQTDGSSVDDFRLGPGPGGALAGEVTVDPGLVNSSLSGGHIDLGVWILIALVRDGSAYRVSVGAITARSGSVAGSIHPSTNPVLLGADCNSCGTTPSSDFVAGAIDEVRIESVARSDGWLIAEALDLADQLGC
jgi:hypothetical protein